MIKHFKVYKGLPKSIYILFLSTLINKIGGFITPLMTLILTVKIGLIESQVGLISTIAMVSQVPFIIIGGALVDRFGAKYVIVFLHTLGALLYLICAFMPPHMGLAIMIILASDIYATASPAPNALVPRVTSKAKTKSAYSLLYLGMNLGLAIGPLFGGLLFNNHLPLLFIIDGVTTLLSAGLVLFLFDEKTDSALKEVNQSQTITDNQGQDNRLNKDKTYQTYHEALDNDLHEETYTKLHHENHHKKTSMLTYLKTHPIILFVSGVSLIYNFCYIQWNFLLPLQTVSLFGLKGPQNFSLLLSLNAVTVVALSPFLTSFTDRIASIKNLFIGGLFYMASFGLFALSQRMWLFILAIVIMTIGEIMISINMNSFIALSVPEQFIGRANSLTFIVSGVGYAIGPVIMGYIITAISYTNAWWLVAGITAIGTLLMYILSHFEPSNTQ